jgi:hypothetical protein
LEGELINDPLGSQINLRESAIQIGSKPYQGRPEREGRCKMNHNPPVSQHKWRTGFYILWGTREMDMVKEI